MAGAVIGALRVDLDLGTAGWEAGLSRVQKQAQGFGSSFARVGTGITAAGAVLSAGITAPFVLFARQAISAASDAGELQSAFNATFGAMADDMNKWAEATGNAMGRSTQEMQQGANAFGLYFNQATKTREEAAKLSKDFTVLAQDLASFHNTGVDEALLALRSGLSGESEPMRRYGVFLNDAAVSAKALAMGLEPVNKKFTDQQKIMARAALIMDATKTAQGDVMRTSQSTANQTRAMNSAWQELQVTVGQTLLPVITPLIGKLSDVLKAFTSLPAPMQQTVVVAVALGAALGPIMLGLGPLITGIGALIPLVVGWGASMSAAAVAAGGFLPLLAPLLPVLAAVAAAAGAAYLVWKNWGTVGPMLQGFGQAVMDALGPSAINLLNALKEAALAVWNSAFVQGIGQVLGVVARFQLMMAEAFGTAIPGVLRALGALFSSVFDMIAAAIRGVVAILTGDWAGAWSAAVDFVGAFDRGVRGVFSGLVDAVIAYVSSMVRGIDEWLGGRLTAAWNKVRDGVEQVKGYFRGMWDAVVGHSYVPDMVDGIAAQMDRLDSVMVAKAGKATAATSKLFKDLADDVQPLLDRLFPEAAALRQMRADLDLVERAAKAGMLSAEQAEEARGRIYRGGAAEDPRMPDLEVSEEIVKIGPALDDLLVKLPDLSAGVKNHTAEVVRSFAEMAEDVLYSVRDMVAQFKSGDIVDGIVSFLGLIGQVIGSIQGMNGGQGLGGIFKFLGGSTPPFGGSRALGGPVVPGRMYRVGERGPEWFTPNTRGRINPGSAGPGGGGNVYHISGNLLTPEFWAQIEGKVEAGGMRAAAAGHEMTLNYYDRRARRQF